MALKIEHIAKGIAIDSRCVKPGNCFFAIKGPDNNGEDYLKQAFDRGADFAVVSKTCKYNSSKLIQVDNVISAMGKLAKIFRQQQSFKVIAITGSAGKTTTRDLINHILCEKYQTHQPIRNYNNDIGLPFTILTAPSKTQICILELGTSAPGEIGYLSDIARPDIALITNTYPAHLDGLGSFENIIAEKASIASGLSPLAKLIINDSSANLKKYLDDNSITYDVFSAENIDIKPALPSTAFLENIAAAWQVVKNFGITKDYFQHRLTSFKAVPMRMEIINVSQKTIINDCYNANPASMKAGLELLKNLSNTQNKRSVFICGDMLELGNQEQLYHHQLASDIVSANVKLLLTVGQLTKTTAQKAELMGLKVHHFKNSAQLSDKLHNFIKDDDIILIKGSRSVKLESVLNAIIA